MRRLWDDDPDAVVAVVNDLLRESRALPQLVRHDDEPYHVHAVPRDAPLATRMAVEAAMAVADLVRGDELGRLRHCAHPECGNVLVDLSRNRSRRFCEAGCGNRVAVSAYGPGRRPVVDPEQLVLHLALLRAGDRIGPVEVEGADVPVGRPSPAPPGSAR